MADESNHKDRSFTRPSITIPPPRPPPEALSASTSPSPMAIVSNFFADGDFRGSFSQLLAGVMASPSASAIAGTMSLLGDGSSGSGQGFKQNRPANLTVPVQAPASTFFPVSPGFSPSAFFNSPAAGFFSPTLSPFGTTHQQALAQVTAQAAPQFAYPSSSSAADSIDQPVNTHQSLFTFGTNPQENYNAAPSSTQRPPEPPRNAPLPAPVGKPDDDGYNWRKYGQKQVKSSEYPRSYYKCTHPNCPVKKKVERSRHGHITEIIYKGQHNHGLPHPGRKAKESSGFQLSRLDEATSIQLNGPSDSEESADGYEDEDDEEPSAKRRNMGAGTYEGGMLHKTVTDPKIVVQTRSPVDLLDDGYRWRKYGQKVVKGNSNPRSYYKCTFIGCNVRKQVERSSTDREAVITTYEGKHQHDVPVGRNSGKNASSDPGNQGQRPNSFLRMKEEQDFV